VNRILAAAFGAALFASPAEAAINLLTNGDFESGVNGALPTGWNATTSTGGQIAVLRGSQYIPCCGTFGTTTNLANSFASFGAGEVDTTGAVLGQTFATIVGRTYDFSFQWGALGAGANNVSYSVGGVSGGDVSGGALLTASNNLDTTLSTVFGSFVATAAVSQISFSAAGLGLSIDPIVDNVSVSSAVPEPATWAMMLIGFAGLSLASRRRRIAVAV